jgi:hypothetical protein
MMPPPVCFTSRPPLSPKRPAHDVVVRAQHDHVTASPSPIVSAAEPRMSVKTMACTAGAEVAGP